MLTPHRLPPQPACYTTFATERRRRLWLGRELTGFTLLPLSLGHFDETLSHLYGEKAKSKNKARQAAALQSAGRRDSERVRRRREDYMHLNGLQLCLMRAAPCWEFSAETVTVSHHDSEQPPDTGSELLTRHSRHRDSNNFAATCHGQFLDPFFG